MLRSERLRALRNTWAGKAGAGQHFVGQHATDTVTLAWKQEPLRNPRANGQINEVGQGVTAGDDHGWSRRRPAHTA